MFDLSPEGSYRCLLTADITRDVDRQRPLSQDSLTQDSKVIASSHSRAPVSLTRGSTAEELVECGSTVQGMFYVTDNSTTRSDSDGTLASSVR